MSKKSRIFSGVQQAFTASLTVALTLTLTVSQLLAGDPVNVSLAPGDIHEVNVRIDYDGSVVIFNQGETAEQDSETVIPLKVRAAINYEQLCVESSKQALRHYKSAHADITVDQTEKQSTLGDKNRNINVYLAGERSVTKPVMFASQDGILEQSEYELLTTHFDPIAVPQFLGKDEVELNEEWTPCDQDLANVLSIDLIYSNEVKLVVKSRTQTETKMYITGKASGQVDGEDIEVTLLGLAKLNNQTNTLKSLRITIKENRFAGQIAPGFEGTIKIDLQTAKKKKTESLSKEFVASASTFRPQKLAWNPDNSFHMFFDPRWRMITAEDEGAVMRLLDDGMVLAQCNIVQLPSRPADKLLTLKEFRDQVGSIVGDSSAEIVSAKENQTSRGLSTLKVDVVGTEKDITFRWVYYHVAHNDGRRLTFIFTVEDEVYDRFSRFGNSLVDSVIFEPVEREAKNEGPGIRK